ncbi:protein of unknown function [Methylorubrum extorquens]|uniref:Uncharacterized protein n=1 Tax=Methylorubrum extorquens TaxID=408 RepID=A0A2N9AIE1_METEX|nr:protein of unknown function [Methylorubrum extorquens]
MTTGFHRTTPLPLIFKEVIGLFLGTMLPFQILKLSYSDLHLTLLDKNSPLQVHGPKMLRLRALHLEAWLQSINLAVPRLLIGTISIIKP